MQLFKEHLLSNADKIQSIDRNHSDHIFLLLCISQQPWCPQIYNHHCHWFHHHLFIFSCCCHIPHSLLHIICIKSFLIYLFLLFSSVLLFFSSSSLSWALLFIQKLVYLLNWYIWWSLYLRMRRIRINREGGREEREEFHWSSAIILMQQAFDALNLLSSRSSLSERHCKSWWSRIKNIESNQKSKWHILAHHTHFFTSIND